MIYKYFIANTLFNSSFDRFIPGFLRKNFIKKKRLYYVPTNLKFLPEKNYTILSNIDHHIKVINQFNQSSNEVVKTKSFPTMIELLKKLYTSDCKFSFLDYGGEEIDQYLVLKKEFKNINYFLINQKQINNDFRFLINKYNFSNFFIVDKEEDLLNFEYDFVNFGSVIQYISNYQSTLNIVLKKSKKYVLFSGVIFFVDALNEVIIVKQLNMWPTKLYSHFINYRKFIQTLKENNFNLNFEKENNTNLINFDNHELESIFYKDLFFKKTNSK